MYTYIILYDEQAKYVQTFTVRNLIAAYIESAHPNSLHVPFVKI